MTGAGLDFVRMSSSSSAHDDDANDCASPVSANPGM